MQYSFDFSKKPATPELNLNHLDYKQLSGFAEFTEKLNSFNEQYDMELVATKGSRWQPGTYNKIKASVDNIIYPHWKKRRGANNLHKLLERNEWRYINFKDELHALDNMLYRYRKEGIELYAKDDLEKAKEELHEILDKFTNSHDDIKISIEPIPHFGRRLRGYGSHGYNDDGLFKPARLYPIINNDNEIIGSHNEGIYDSWEAYQDAIVENNKINNPGEWFVNIRIAIRDIDINVTNSSMNKEYAKLPYGDLILSFTVDLITLLINYRRLLKKKHMIKTEFIGTVATKFPIYKAYEHPFVYRKTAYGNTMDVLSYFNSYGNGNVCLGELSSDIYQSLFSGNLELLKSYVNIWARSFSAGVTSPLNTLSHTHFGVPKEWDEATRAIISSDKATCKREVNNYTSEQKRTFTEKFCSNCDITDRCSVYTKLTFDSICWIDECDKDFSQAYAELQYHLKDEVDEKKVYEMFADLYYYKSKPETWTLSNIERVFNLPSKSYKCKDITDYDSILNTFHKDGPTMDNIIELYEVMERTWYLTRIHEDNKEMWAQLVDKTVGLTFKEAITKLTTRDIENNYYSWLFASSGIPRDDFWTYTRMLQYRKEGVRYGN
jgi:hypothetical protein